MGYLVGACACMIGMIVLAFQFGKLVHTICTDFPINPSDVTEEYKEKND